MPMDPIDGIEGVMAATGTKSNVLVIQKGRYNEANLLNVRRWYISRKTGEWLPTKKGISLNSTNFEFVRNVFDQEKENIESWLQESSVAGEATRDLEDSVRGEHWESTGLVVRAGDWKSPELCRMEAMGGTEVLELNKRHPLGAVLAEFVERREDQELNDDATAMLTILIYLLASLERIPLMFEGSQTWKADELFDTMRWNLGMLLRSSTRGKGIGYDV